MCERSPVQRPHGGKFHPPARDLYFADFISNAPVSPYDLDFFQDARKGERPGGTGSLAFLNALPREYFQIVDPALICAASLHHCTHGRTDCMQDVSRDAAILCNRVSKIQRRHCEG